MSKIDLVYENVTSLESNYVNDETIKKFLTISNLKEQLLRSEK
jgi:hypothetical protein